MNEKPETRDYDAEYLSYKAGIEKGRQQVYDWGNEECPDSIPSDHILRRECDKCWQKLEKEIVKQEKEREMRPHIKYIHPYPGRR